MGVHLVAFGIGAYAASKAALEMFTEALYLELPGTGVRAHLVVPGGTTTEFSTPRDGNDPPFPQDPATLAAPEEVAAAIVAATANDQFMSFATARDAVRRGDEGGRPQRVPRRDAGAPRRPGPLAPGRSARSISPGR